MYTFFPNCNSRCNSLSEPSSLSSLSLPFLYHLTLVGLLILIITYLYAWCISSNNVEHLSHSFSPSFAFIFIIHDICLSFCLSVCLSVSVSLSICLGFSFCLSLSFSLSLLPLWYLFFFCSSPSFCSSASLRLLFARSALFSFCLPSLTHTLDSNLYTKSKIGKGNTFAAKSFDHSLQV